MPYRLTGDNGLGKLTPLKGALRREKSQQIVILSQELDKRIIHKHKMDGGALYI